MQSKNHSVEVPERFAGVRELGKELQVHQVEFSYRWLNAVLGAIILTAAGLAAIYGVYDTSLQVAKHGPVLFGKAIILPLLLSALLFVPGVLFLVSAWQNWNKAVVFYELGLGYNDRHGLQLWEWEDVERMHIDISRKYQTGFLIGTSHLYTLYRADGTRLRLDSRFRQIEALGQVISRKVTPYQRERLLRGLRTGQIVKLGPVSISPQGLTIKKKTFAWDEVEAVELQNGFFFVKTKDDEKLSRVNAPVASIPNLDALFEVVHSIIWT